MKAALRKRIDVDAASRCRLRQGATDLPTLRSGYVRFAPCFTTSLTLEAGHGEDDGGIRIDDISLRADEVGEAFRFVELVDFRDGPVLGAAAARAPAAVGDAQGNGGIQRRAVGPGLAAADDFRELVGGGLHGWE